MESIEMKFLYHFVIMVAMIMALLATSSLTGESLGGVRLAPRDPTISALTPDATSAHPRAMTLKDRCHTPLECIRLVALAKRALANLPPGTVFDDLATIGPGDDSFR